MPPIDFAPLTKAPGLCHRCEHRIQFNEVGHAPRFECSGTGAVYSCYMWTPVLPLLMEPNDGDDRPVDGGWMIAPRSHAVRVACKGTDVDLKLHYDSAGRFLKHWVPMPTQVVPNKRPKKK